MRNPFDLNKNIDDFINKRQEIFQNKYREEPYVLIHLIPKKNFIDHFYLSVLDIQSIFQNSKPNSLGISIDSDWLAYSIHRNGTIEMFFNKAFTYDNNKEEKKKFFPFTFLEILDETKIFIHLAQLYNQYQINPPYYVSFIIDNVKDYILFHHNSLFQQKKCIENTIKIPKFEVNELPQKKIIDSELKPVMDIIANAFGYIQWDF